MFCLARKMVNDEDTAKDILQEIFISFYEKLQQCHQILQPTSWLMRATVNKSIDYLERQKKFTDFETLNQDFAEEETNVNQDEIIINQALKQLKPHEKSLAILYSEGFSYQEISQMTGIKFSSVGTSLSRTLQKLKEHLKKMNYEMY